MVTALLHCCYEPTKNFIINFLKGGIGAFAPPPPPSEALPPFAPSQMEKMTKISYFLQFFWFLPPQIRIFPSMPHHKKFSGAATEISQNYAQASLPLSHTF